MPIPDYIKTEQLKASLKGVGGKPSRKKAVGPNFALQMGFDPEVFLARNSKKLGGKPSLALASGFTCGTKGFPEYKPGGIGVLADGVALEFNTKRPARSADEFKLLRDRAIVVLQTFGGYTGNHVIKVPEELRSTPDFTELGCEPDYCVYERTMMPPMSVESLGPIRYAGGHIHVSIVPENDESVDPHIMAKAMDLFVGSWLCSYANGIRRNVMGAGRIRIKGNNYIEYRTPSNRWFIYGGYCRAIWVATEAAMRACLTDDGKKFIEDASPLARELINRPYKDGGDERYREVLALLTTKPSSTKEPWLDTDEIPGPAWNVPEEKL